MKISGKKKVRARAARVLSKHALVGTWEDPEEKFQMLVRYNHPMAGTWQEVENPISETSVVYEIAVAGGQFAVSGIDEGDGTKLTISNVKWDGSALYFTSVYPRTGHCVEHELRAFKPGLVKHYVTSTNLELWRKRSKTKKRKSS
ncbi:MAG TPA: hypothetical protein VK302_02815 [Terriglobales bacterium]|nr:hypothetical protein [Terriglobales bacterium]